MADALEQIRRVIRRQLPPDSGVTEHDAYMEIIEIMDLEAVEARSSDLTKRGPSAIAQHPHI